MKPLVVQFSAIKSDKSESLGWELRHPCVSLDGVAKQLWYSLVANHKAVKVVQYRLLCLPVTPGKTCWGLHGHQNRLGYQLPPLLSLFNSHVNRLKESTRRNNNFYFSTKAPTRFSCKCSCTLIHTKTLHWNQGQWQSEGCFCTECGPDLENLSATFLMSSRWLIHCLLLEIVM